MPYHIWHHKKLLLLPFQNVSIHIVGVLFILLLITFAVALRSIHICNILIAAPFATLVVLIVPSTGDVCLPIACFFFFVLTVPGVTNIVVDVRDGGDGVLHAFDEGRG